MGKFRSLRASILGWRAVSAFIGGAIIITSSGYSNFGPPEAHADDAAIAAEAEQFRQWLTEAWNRQDIDKILSYCRPDIVVTWQDAKVSRGVDEVRKYIVSKTKGPNAVVERVSANPIVDGRTVVGDHIISVGQMNDEFVLKDDGGALRLNSRFSAWLTRENGKLLLAGIHFSSNVFDNDVQKKALRKMETIVAGAGAALGLIIGVVLGRITKRGGGRR